MPTDNIHEDHHENVHRVEFEAPASPTSNPPTTARPFSIDLSLELERQLTDMESPPNSPPADSETPATAKPQRESLDPDVLAHIVVQLRNSLMDMTKERDELVKMLSSVNSQEASLKDALQLMTDKATDAEEQLTEARKKAREDEEQITMLRAKVEESRRGLMRLQTESRRQSTIVADSPHSGLLSFGSPQQSKRASFTPLTGSLATARPAHGHRRISSISSVSDNHFTGADTSVPALTHIRLPLGMPVLVVFQELESLRKEVSTLREELDTAKHELSEALEAKDASEECVKTLREFIAENNIGVSDASGAGALPSPAFIPPPPAAKGDHKRAASGWGFNLWKLDAALKPSGSNSPSTPTATTAAAVTPLTQKLGGFFGSKTPSITSASSAQSTSTLPPVRTSVQRESMYSSSDASSVAEPVSPGDDIHGLGSGAMVQGVSNLSDLGVTTELGKGVPVGSGGPHIVLG
ncbi:hypothetical protein BDQ17DRAFT_1544010 [Cyathus striatus]|nr:hypothetical protein BDQ17DRAFT_1544010 [Cyathus striatus]